MADTGALFLLADKKRPCDTSFSVIHKLTLYGNDLLELSTIKIMFPASAILQNVDQGIAVR